VKKLLAAMFVALFMVGIWAICANIEAIAYYVCNRTDVLDEYIIAGVLSLVICGVCLSATNWGFGIPLPWEEVVDCPACGKEISRKARVCPKCGADNPLAP
jgi:hypothetical protein